MKTEIIRAFALLSDGKNLDILLDWLTYTDNVQIQIECIKAIISLNAIDLLKNTTIKDPELLAQIETVLKNH